MFYIYIYTYINACMYVYIGIIDLETKKPYLRITLKK